jgi:hypothetical protein
VKGNPLSKIRITSECVMQFEIKKHNALSTEFQLLLIINNSNFPHWSMDEFLFSAK